MAGVAASPDDTTVDRRLNALEEELSVANSPVFGSLERCAVGIGGFHPSPLSPESAYVSPYNTANEAPEQHAGQGASEAPVRGSHSAEGLKALRTQLPEVSPGDPRWVELRGRPMHGFELSSIRREPLGGFESPRRCSDPEVVSSPLMPAETPPSAAAGRPPPGSEHPLYASWRRRGKRLRPASPGAPARSPQGFSALLCHNTDTDLDTCAYDVGTVLERGESGAPMILVQRTQATAGFHADRLRQADGDAVVPSGEQTISVERVVAGATSLRKDGAALDVPGGLAGVRSERMPESVFGRQRWVDDPEAAWQPLSLSGALVPPFPVRVDKETATGNPGGGVGMVRLSEPLKLFTAVHIRVRSRSGRMALNILTAEGCTQPEYFLTADGHHNGAPISQHFPFFPQHRNAYLSVHRNSSCVALSCEGFVGGPQWAIDRRASPVVAFELHPGDAVEFERVRFEREAVVAGVPADPEFSREVCSPRRGHVVPTVLQ